jgi:hypothetical protein
MVPEGSVVENLSIARGASWKTLEKVGLLPEVEFCNNM